MFNLDFDIEKYKNVWGIYSITNLINNKKYIGSAINIYERLTQHYNELNKQKHFNKHLQQSWLKYGEDNFIFRIVEVCINIEYSDLLKKEDEYIKKYNTLDSNVGYNKRLNSEFPILNRDSILKREAKVNKKKIKIMLFNSNTGEFYKEFNSVKEASLFLNNSTTNISRVIDKISRSVNGFVVVSSNLYDKNKCYKKEPFKRSVEDILNRQRNSSLNKIVYIYNLNGDLIESCQSYIFTSKKYFVSKNILPRLLYNHKCVKFNNLLFSNYLIKQNDFYNTYKNAWIYKPGVHRNQFI